MSRPDRLMTSAMVAPLAALLLAVVLSVWDGWNWKEPVGLLQFTLLFIFPFTFVGTFAVLTPFHRLISSVLDGASLQISLIIVAALGGSLLLHLVSDEILAAGVVGAISGAVTAALWLVVYRVVSKADSVA